MISQLIRYLVIEALIDRKRLRALYDYLNDESLGIVADRYGLDKDTIRGMASRIRQLGAVYLRIAKYVIPFVIEKVSEVVTFKDGGKWAICGLCGKQILVKHLGVVYIHIDRYHSTYVEKLVGSVIEDLRKCCRQGYR